MYDQIFDDFATIKQHLENNGNHQFEESAVFELLESLYPLHGSAQSIQIITDMLDAQRIRDSNYGSDKASDIESSCSNEKDDNDIIEVMVPKKVHPIIDLTENSAESDNSEASCHEVNSFSDSDASKNFNDDSNLTCESATRSNSEKQLLNYLAILDQPNEGLQLHNDSAETSEMLEENNNDPNNNFDEENAGGNHVVQNNSNSSNILPNAPELPHYSEVLDNLFNGILDRDPIPGCSKETSLKFEMDNTTKPTENCSIFNSVPGCSKELNDLHNNDLIEKNDDSIEKDITCIQEIIPWADSDQTRSLLLKYSNSPDRKQSTLSKLMKEESTRMKIKVKRKAISDIHCVEKKALKLESMYEMDDSMDNPNLNFDNIISNESSSDSQSSKPSRHMESTFKANQNPQASNDADFPKMFPRNMWSYFESSSPSSSNLVNFNFPVISHSSSNKPILHHTMKKERNETVVSGLLQEQNHLELLNGKNLTDQSVTVPSTSVSKSSVSDPFFPNDDRFPLNNSLHNHQTKDEVIEKTLKEEADNILNDIPTMNGFAKHCVTIPSPSKDRIVIQPSKLRLQITTNPTVIQASPKSNIMRPAILNLNNSQQSKEKTLEPKITGSYKNYSARPHGYIPPELNVVKKQVPLLNPIQHVPTVTKIATAVRESASTKEVLHKTCMNTDIHRPFNLASKIVAVKRNPEAIKRYPETAKKNLETFNRNVEALKRDLETVERNPETVKRNPETLKRNPETLKRNLETFKRNLEALKRNPEAVISNSEPVQPKPLPNSSVAEPGTSGLNSNGTSNSTVIPDQTIYNKLRSIFPDVKSSYIKKICINPPIVNNIKDKAYVLNALIEHLLNEGPNHLRPVEFVIDQPVASVTTDEKYEYLLGIFPDADPTYIREFVIKNPSEQEFQDFIQGKLESRDYPTKEQYMARIKITEQIKQYTTDLNIENFLELFPDPFKHFEDASRKCVHRTVAFEFLKSLFIRNKVLTISQQYKINRFNLSLTAKALTSIGPDMKTKRMILEMPTEDIPLLQEMAFIKNKQNIINHLNMLKTKEEQLFKELKDQNLLITCQCCYNDECMPTKSSECNEGHVFCHECIIRGTESALADAEAHVRCFTDCQSEFSLATLQKVLPPTKFSALLQKRQTAEVIAAGVDGLVSCPFCHFASIPPAEDKVFKCLNPECMKETCKLCKELNHVPLKCDEVIKTDKARHLIEEKMTEALVRTCYSCKKQFYKEDGCNKMKCTCGALMCYLCSKPIKGYDHFNAQGGANTNLCPLWSDDRVLNAKAVIQVAENVKKQLLKNNPNLKIDTDSLLPKVPAKSRGPHDDIPNAHQLPEHIMRIANVREGNV